MTESVEIGGKPYPRHPLSAIFGQRNPEAVAAIKESIMRHGQQYPILVLKDGAVIDGWTRLCAIAELRNKGFMENGRLIEPFTEVSLEPLEDAIAANLARGNMTASEWARCVHEMDAWNARNGGKVSSLRKLAKYAGVAVDTMHRARLAAEGRPQRPAKARTTPPPPASRVLEPPQEPAPPPKTKKDEIYERNIELSLRVQELEEKVAGLEEELGVITENDDGRPVTGMEQFKSLQLRNGTLVQENTTLRKRNMELEAQVKTLRKQLGEVRE